MSDPNQEFHAPPPPPVIAEPERARPTYLMWTGVALFVVGILAIVLGLPFVNILVGGFRWGAGLCVLGIISFAFSFIRMPAVDNPPPHMSTVGTLTGIFFEPTNVFRNLRAHPQFLAALLLAGMINGAYSVAFTHRLTPERIINFTMDKLEDSPIKPPPEAMAKARTDGVAQAKAPTAQLGDFVSKIVTAFIGAAIIAGLLLLCVLIFGG